MDEEEFFGDGIGQSVFGGAIEIEDEDGDGYDDDGLSMGMPVGPNVYQDPQTSTQQAPPAQAGLGAYPVAVSGEEISNPSNASLGAAITLFMIAAGGVGGYHYGKAKGAAGGVLAAGGFRNLTQMKGSGLKGGLTKGLIGLTGLGLGGYLLFTANETKGK